MRVLLGLMIVVGATFPSWAQGTLEQRVACTGDAFKFCSSNIPNIPEIIVCMKANFRNLTPACQAQFKAPEKKARRPSGV